jgi:hypothetical protein
VKGVEDRVARNAREFVVEGDVGPHELGGVALGGDIRRQRRVQPLDVLRSRRLGG